jgi:hypothetical protein
LEFLFYWFSAGQFKTGFKKNLIINCRMSPRPGVFSVVGYDPIIIELLMFGISDQKDALDVDFFDLR